MPKISVVVPVYGVEEYIEQCARSLFSQTFSDIEYLFIDDCSPDSSIPILESVLKEFPERMSQVHIHKMPRNVGQAKARQLGMQIATGDYVIHCDSDDWIVPNAYELLYEKSQQSMADIVYYDFYITDGENHTINKRLHRHFYDKMEILDLLLCGKVTGSLCGALFRRSLYLNNFEYPKADMGEDWAMVIQMVLNCKTTISYLPLPLYYYRQHQNSISKASSEICIIKRFKDNLINGEQVYKCIEDAGLSVILKRSIASSKFIIKKQLLMLATKPGFYEEWRLTYPEINKNILFNSKVSVKDKLIHILCYFHAYHLLK